MQLDGDSAPLIATPDTLVNTDLLSVGSRVRCELTDRRVIAHGVSGGTEAPTGCVVMTAAAAAPVGWLLCQGQAVSRTDYAALFAAIATQFGTGDGSTTFNVPNLQGRVPAGYSAGDANFGTLGGVGGEATHALSYSEMPQHSHGISGPTGGVLSGAGGGGSGYVNGAGYAPWFGGGYSAGPATVTVEGGGAAHNNLQPFAVLNFIIKA